MSNHIVNTEQADAWEKAGPFWLQMQERFDRQWREQGLRCLGAAEPSPGEAVLDIGCGTGTSSFQLAQGVGPDGSVVGADISSTMVEAATSRAQEARHPNVSFVVADAQVHQFDQPFDLAFSRFGVMFFADPAAAFANIHATLKPTGMCSHFLPVRRKSSSGTPCHCSIYPHRTMKRSCPTTGGY